MSWRSTPTPWTTYGAVHEETAREMADGARPEWPVPPTGYPPAALPAPTAAPRTSRWAPSASDWPDRIGAYGKRYYFPFGKRLMNKKIFAMAALDLLREKLGIG
jgi:nicotinamide-nucleotide amidase